MKDSRWSLDLFRCESATLRTYWVLMVMDQYTRRIIGFGIQAGAVNGSEQMTRTIAHHSFHTSHSSAKIREYSTRPQATLRKSAQHDETTAKSPLTVSQSSGGRYKYRKD
jgi:hypothetical protein